MAEARQRGLGRGLSALLGEVAEPLADTPPAAGSTGTALEAPIEALRRNPDQPRKHFGEAEIEELAASIREKGVLQPILVRALPDEAGVYQIVAGERRWRASQRAELKTVPILVRSFSDEEVLEIGVVENVQRADLNPIEEAQGYKALIDRFGRTQDAVAQAVGKSRSHVANALRLLTLPQSVLDHLASGRLSAGHARAVAAAADPAALAERIVEGGLNVRQAEALARGSGADRGGERAPPSGGDGRAKLGKDSDTRALEQDLESLLGLPVEIEFRGGRGELRIRYANIDQLDDVCRRLSRPA